MTAVATAAVAAPSRKSAKIITLETAIERQKSDDKKMARLTKRTNEQLITLALQCLADRDDAQQEYDLITEVLEERFPHQENEERIITPAGIATRTVTNSYAVAGDEEHEQDASAQKLKEILGKGYDVCVSETTDYAVPKHLYPDLVKELGSQSGRFIRQSTRYTLTAKFRRMFAESGIDFSEVVTHKRKRKITVEPAAN